MAAIWAKKIKIKIKAKAAFTTFSLCNFQPRVVNFTDVFEIYTVSVSLQFII
jgi:hypothetical protein